MKKYTKYFILCFDSNLDKKVRLNLYRLVSKNVPFI